MRAFLPLGPAGRLYLARDSGGLAILEIQPRRYILGWDVTRLAARGDFQQVLGPAFRAAVEHLRSKGVPRLFARCEESAADVLHGYDFQIMAREIVLVGPAARPQEESELPFDSRYRIPPDAWPLHQLETALTPPLIRQLEGLTSLDWSRTVKDMSEIVVERDGRLVAWLGWGTQAGPHMSGISLLIDPDYSSVAPDLIDHALKQTRNGWRLVARVREYHVEALQAFRHAGFEVVTEEVMVLRHAGVELVRELKPRLQVAPVSTVPGFNVSAHPCRFGIQSNPDVRTISRKKVVRDGIA